MEDRVATRRSERPGAALIALAAILAITAAWWALALWPAGGASPEWLVRTRSACFGARPDGLPDAGGWILLIGEPLGMLGVLAALCGRSLRRDLLCLRTHRAVRFVAMSLATLALLAGLTLAPRIARAWAAGSGRPLEIPDTRQRVDRAVPDVGLIDQAGNRITLGDLRGRTVLLTFAYGHCTTICPAVVRRLEAARRSSGRIDVPIVVLTLDPWRDTPDRLPTIARYWGLAAGDRVLSGNVADVERALNELGIGRRRDATNGDVEHLSTVMIVDARGRVAWRVDGGTTGVAALLAAR